MSGTRGNNMSSRVYNSDSLAEKIRREKISKSLKEQWASGKKTALRPKGFKMSEEQKRKIGIANSISLKSKIPSRESIKKGLETKKGYRHSEETKRKIGKSNAVALKGNKLSVETRMKLSLSHKGEKSYLWKGGISTENSKIRNSIEMRLWREAVFKRDDWTCVLCKERGGKLNADHIKRFADYPELRFELLNGRTLCVICHRKTDTWGSRQLLTL